MIEKGKIMKKILIVSGVLSCLLFALPLYAEENCSNDFGECTVNVDDVVSFSCTCKDGVAVDGGYGMDGDVGEEFEAPEADCEQILQETCPSFEKCSSDKGICTIYDDYNNCTCADGSHQGEGSSGGSEGVDGDVVSGDDPVDGDAVSGDDPDEEEAARFKEGEQSCEQILMEECPNDPPDPANECSDKAFEACNGIAQWFSECFENDVWPFEIIDCCEYFEEDSEAISDEYNCLKDKDCDSGVDECMARVGEDYTDLVSDEGGANTADGDVTDDKSDDGSESDQGSGDSGSDCNQTSGGSMAILLLMLALVGLRKKVFNA